MASFVNLGIFDDFIRNRPVIASNILIINNESTLNMISGIETASNIGPTNQFLYSQTNGLLSFAGLSAISPIFVSSNNSNILVDTFHYTNVNLGNESNIFSGYQNGGLLFRNVIGTGIQITTNNTNIILDAAGSITSGGTGIILGAAPTYLVSSANNSGLFISKRQHGMMYTITSALITITTTPTNIIIPTSVETAILGFTQISNSQFRYIGNNTAVFSITGGIHTDGTDQVIGAIAVNGVAIPNTGTIMDGLSNGFVDCVMNTIYLLSPNDILTARINRTSGSNTYNITRYWMITQELSRWPI
jgi:hypothetical protein